MFLQGVLFAVTVVVSCTAVGLPTYNSIEPVDLNYHCIQIREAQETDKSPVLLLHGLALALSDWRVVQQNLALYTNRKVCAVDLRNHGDSPWNKRTDVAAMTADIAHFLEKQKIERVNLVGHSLGGKTAVHFALNHPNKVDSVVVEDMRPNGITPEALDGVKVFVRLLREAIRWVPEGLDKEEARQHILNYVNQRLEENGSAGLNETIAESFEIRLVYGKWQWKANLKVLDDALDRPEELLTESRGLYGGPTLFIYGSESSFDVGGDKGNILRLFPVARLIPVAGAGHFIHENFGEFEDEVIKFLNSEQLVNVKKHKHSPCNKMHSFMNKNK